MGEVYEAWDDELSIRVALKALHGIHDSRLDLHRLKLEGLMARSVWHPNVCRVYNVSHDGKDKATVWFLTMELLKGETLSRVLQKVGRLPLDRTLQLAEQMAAGLGAAHRAGVVHRDFKPSNVVLVNGDNGEQAMVTDFGTAQAPTGERRDPSGHGHPAYMAPEQVRGEDVGPAADIYAFGVVLFEMVTGTLPFGGDSPIEVARRRLVADPPSPRSVVPGIDDRWEQAIPARARPGPGARRSTGCRRSSRPSRKARASRRAGAGCPLPAAAHAAGGA
jgi:serine/threonine protein kinase